MDTIAHFERNASNPAEDPYVIEWVIIVDGHEIRTDRIHSKTEMCVTWQDPAPLGLSEYRYFTVYEIACRMADGIGGLITDAQRAAIVTAIWGECTDRIVLRGWDDQQMKYYGNWLNENTETAHLIRDADGQCGSWVSLFLEALRIHQIDYPGEYAVLGWDPPEPTGFNVANWTLVLPGQSGDASYPLLNVRKMPHIVENGYQWAFAEVNDAAGVAGQGNANPDSLFNNHQVARINGLYYDPAYGTTYTGLAAFRAVLHAFFYRPDAYFVNVLLREGDTASLFGRRGDRWEVLEFEPENLDLNLPASQPLAPALIADLEYVLDAREVLKKEIPPAPKPSPTQESKPAEAE